jgi:hypothetical protein
MDSTNKKVAPGANRATQETTHDQNPTPPMVTGQCAQVFNLISQHQPIWSLTLTADYAIPEAAARVHNLRAMGFNILTTIHPTVIFRGVERHNVASYSLGTPAWPRPGFFDGGEGDHA